MTTTAAAQDRLLPRRTPAALLALARFTLTDAERTRPVGLRYATAHLAALRAAAAIVAGRARPERTSTSRLPSVWVLLAEVAPEYGQWAEHFADITIKRAAAEAGIPNTVSARDADDMVDAAGRFLEVAEMALGLSKPDASPKEDRP